MNEDYMIVGLVLGLICGKICYQWLRIWLEERQDNKQMLLYNPKSHQYEYLRIDRLSDLPSNCVFPKNKMESV